MDEQTLTFFRTIYHKVPNLKAHVAWGSLDSPTYLTLEQLFSGEVAAISPNQHQFYSPTIRNPDPTVGQKKEGVIGGCVAWLDKDLYKGDWPEPLLPPSAIVETGGGQHLYWLLDGFYKPDVVEKVNQSLSAHMREKELASQGCWQRNRVLRVPGSFNHKSEYNPPRPVRVVKLEPGLVYSPKDLVRLRAYSDGLLDIPTNGNGGGDESKRDFRLVTTLLKWGLPEELVKLSLLEFSSKAQARDDYVKLTINNAKEAIEAPEELEISSSDDLANFELTPLAHLVGPDGQDLGLALEMVCDDGAYRTSATAADFSSRQTCIAWASKVSASRMVIGSDSKIRQWWLALHKTCPPKTMLRVIHAGRYDRGEQTIFIYNRTSALVYPGEAEVGVIWEPMIDVEAHLKLNKETISKEELNSLWSLSLATQPPDVIRPAMGWMIASLFTQTWVSAGISMPALMLFGARGSGKTTIARSVLLPLIGSFTRSINADITPFALTGHLSLGYWPTWIDEYRASNENSGKFQQLLRTAYDAGSRESGNPSKSVDSYPLVSPTLITGENPFSDSANLDRTVALRLYESVLERENEYVSAFKRLRTWDDAVRSRAAYSLVSWSIEQGRDYLMDHYTRARTVMEDLRVSMRMTSNIAVCFAGWTILADYFGAAGIAAPWSDDPKPFEQAVRNTHTPGLGAVTAIDRLVAQITHFYQNPELGTDWDAIEGILWFNLTRAAHSLRIETVVDMLKLQLEERKSQYIIGPERRAGSAEMWGIDVKKARDLGLDVYQPGKSMGVLM